MAWCWTRPATGLPTIWSASTTTHHKQGAFHVWVTDLATGETDENIGPSYGFPIEFAHPDEQRAGRSDRVPRTMISRSSAARARGSEPRHGALLCVDVRDPRRRGLRQRLRPRHRLDHNATRLDDPGSLRPMTTSRQRRTADRCSTNTHSSAIGASWVAQMRETDSPASACQLSPRLPRLCAASAGKSPTGTCTP